jgi:hypothetical protein
MSTLRSLKETKVHSMYACMYVLYMCVCMYGAMMLTVCRLEELERDEGTVYVCMQYVCVITPEECGQQQAAHIHTRTHMYIHAFIYIYIYTHTHMHSYIYIYIYIYIYTHTHTHRCHLGLKFCLLAHSSRMKSASSSSQLVFTHTHMYIHTFIYMYIYIHTDAIWASNSASQRIYHARRARSAASCSRQKTRQTQSSKAPRLRLRRG